MKKTALLFCLVFVFAGLTKAIAQISIPQPSAKAKVETQVGLTDISIEYFRPSLKGRKIFGEGKDFLQPYGQLWRAGANSGTIIKLSTDAFIGGENVKAGEYLVFMTPNANEWEFKLYSDIKLGGNVNGYNPEKEVISVNVKPTTLNESVETLTYQISDISEDYTTANIHFAWENTSLKIPVEVDFDEMVMAQIEKNTKVNPSNYITAANYYFSANKDLNQALEWVNQYLAVGNNSAQFWNLHLKAQILAKMGEKKKAIETANKSIELAKNYAGGDFGYVKRNEDLIASLK